MADILLSALVSSMVGNLNTSALQEFGVAWGLGIELEKLESTLSTIQAVLQDAEEKQWKSEAIRNWLRKLKEGAQMNYKIYLYHINKITNYENANYTPSPLYLILKISKLGG